MPAACSCIDFDEAVSSKGEGASASGGGALQLAASAAPHYYFRAITVILIYINEIAGTTL
jgi:hypothetical protein